MNIYIYVCIDIIDEYLSRIFYVLVANIYLSLYVFINYKYVSRVFLAIRDKCVFFKKRDKYVSCFIYMLNKIKSKL